MTNLGIDSVVDLPVGYNLQDHFSTSIAFSVPAKTLVWGALIDKTNSATALANYKSGDYADSQWTYVNGGKSYILPKRFRWSSCLETVEMDREEESHDFAGTDSRLLFLLFRNRIPFDGRYRLGSRCE